MTDVARALALLCASGCGQLAPIPETGAPRDPTRDGFTAIAAEVLPTCAVANCHGTPQTAPMSLAADLAYDNLVGAPSAQVPSLNRVEPFEPDASYILHKLRGTAASVGGRPSRMPLNRPPLPDESIEAITRWIVDGAPSD